MDFPARSHPWRDQCPSRFLVVWPGPADKSIVPFWGRRRCFPPDIHRGLPDLLPHIPLHQPGVLHRVLQKSRKYISEIRVPTRRACIRRRRCFFGVCRRLSIIGLRSVLFLTLITVLLIVSFL